MAHDDITTFAYGPPPNIGKYEITREVARGGMAVVYEARDPMLNRRVALKVLDENFASPVVVQRLHREASIVAQLRHPNIVVVHEVGTAFEGNAHIHYIAMDFVDGRTFSDALADTGTSKRDKLRMFEDVLRAVAYAHEKGVVHRDLKPSNVLVDAGGRVLLTDFGLARTAEMVTRLTRTQAIMGTPQYMAPEQVEGRGDQIDARTDVYALGVMLYELLTGGLPFAAGAAPLLFYRILKDDPIPPSTIDPEVEPELEAMCLKAMAKQPFQRYANALEFLDDLQRFHRGEPVRARTSMLFYRVRRKLGRRKAAIFAALGLLAIAMFGVLLLQRTSEDMAAATQQARARERLKRWEQLVQQTRPYLYRKDVDFAEKLPAIEAAMSELQALAQDPVAAALPELWRALGTGRSLLGDAHGAEQALLRAAELAPDHPLTQQELGRVYLELSLLALIRGSQSLQERQAGARAFADKAAACFARASASWAAAEETDRLLAEAYRAFAARDAARVSTICNDALQRFGDRPGTEEFWMLLGWAREGEERIWACSRAIALRPHYAWAYFMRGLAHMQRRAPAEAIRDFDAVIRLRPRFPAAYSNRGLMRKDQDDLDGAIADFTRALELRPDDWDYFLNRGNAHDLRNLLREALADYNAAIARAPQSAVAHFNRAGLYAKMGQTSDAIADYTEAIRLDPAFAAAYNNRGLARIDASDALGALQDFEAAIEANPQYAQAYVNRGMLFAMQNDLPRAMRDFETALEIDPKDATAHAYRANVYLSQGELDRAIREYDQALKLDPNLAMAYANRGNAYRAKGDLPSALADFQAAARSDPKDPNTHFNVGVIHTLLERFDDAIAAYSSALLADPHHLPSLVNRALAWKEAGDRRAAQADLERARELTAPGSIDRQRIEAQLQSLRD